MFESSTNAPNRTLVSLGLATGKTMVVSLKLPLSGKLNDLLNNADQFLDVLGSDGEQFFLAKSLVQKVVVANPPKAGLNLNRRSSDRSHFNPWTVLGIAKDVSPDRLRAAYIALVKRYHPDRFANMDLPQEMKDYAAAMLARINMAYDQIDVAPESR